MPSRGPSSAKYCKLVDERAYSCLPTATTHMFIACKIKGLPIFSWKIIIESFGLFDYHYFFVKMHVRALGQAAGYKTTYCRKTHFASKVRAILQHCTISFWLDSYLICMYVVLLCTTILYYLLMYFL